MRVPHKHLSSLSLSELNVTKWITIITIIANAYFPRHCHWGEPPSSGISPLTIAHSLILLRQSVGTCTKNKNKKIKIYELFFRKKKFILRIFILILDGVGWPINQTSFLNKYLCFFLGGGGKQMFGLPSYGKCIN